MILLALLIGQIEDKPFSVAKLSAYLHLPRTTVIRKLDMLLDWGVIGRIGNSYYVLPTKLNSSSGNRCYRKIRRLVHDADTEMSALDKVSVLNIVSH